jgi:hypothetical protein
MYLAVLMTALIVAVIGLSGLTLSRIQLRSAEGEREIVSARLYAQSAIEMALLAINDDPDWRTTYTHDVWTAARSIGEGTYAWKLVDEKNGDLAKDPSAPVRLYGLGNAGDALRLYSVLIQEPRTGAGSNLLSNPGMENGTTDWLELGDCDLEARDDGPRTGTWYLKVKNRDNWSSGPRQSIVGKITTGTTYDTEAWVRTKDFTEKMWLVVWLRTFVGWTPIYVTSADVGTSWTRISGSFTPTWTGALSEAYWKVHTDWDDQDFMVDDTALAEAGETANELIPIRGTWRREVLP